MAAFFFFALVLLRFLLQYGDNNHEICVQSGNILYVWSEFDDVSRTKNRLKNLQGSSKQSTFGNNQQCWTGLWREASCQISLFFELYNYSQHWSMKLTRTTGTKPVHANSVILYVHVYCDHHFPINNPWQDGRCHHFLLPRSFLAAWQ